MKPAQTNGKRQGGEFVTAKKKKKATHSLTSMVFLSTVDAMIGQTMIPNCSRTHYSAFGGETSKRKCLFVGCSYLYFWQRHVRAHMKCKKKKKYTCDPLSFSLSTACYTIRPTPSETLQRPEDEQTSATRVWNSVMPLAVDVLQPITLSGKSEFIRTIVITYEQRKSNVTTSTRHFLLVGSNYRRNLCPSFLYCRYF